MRWDEHRMFWKGYLNDPMTVGSVAPDSRWCVDALLHRSGIAEANTILEYGSASGSVTREIIARKKPSAVLVCVEKDESFAEHLRQSPWMNNAIVVSEDVLSCDHVLRMNGVRNNSVECIISTLPCTNIPFDTLLRTRVLPYLKRDGIFVQYMHTISFFRGMFPRRYLEPYFHDVRSTVVTMNLPPVVVYTCKFPKQGWDQ